MVFPNSLRNAGSGYGFLGNQKRERLIQIIWDHRPDREDGVRGSTRHRAWFRKNKQLKRAIKKEYGNPILMFFLSIIIQAIVNRIIKELLKDD